MSIKNLVINMAKDLTKDIIKEKLTKLSNKDVENTEEPIELEEVDDSKNFDSNFPLSFDIISTYDFDKVPSPNILNPEGKKTILLVDDIPYTKLLFKSDFKNIDTLYDKKINEDYKIIECFGNKAGWIALKYALIEENTVNFGIFDITLGHVLKYNERAFEIDGIDIACNIYNKFPTMKFLLFTAHSLNKKSSVISKYENKIINGLNIRLEDVYLNKNSNRINKLYNLLYGDTENGN